MGGRACPGLETWQRALPFPILQGRPTALCCGLRTRRTAMRIALFFLAVIASTGAWSHEDDSAKPAADEKLGTVHFPTSCNEGVTRQFDRGMAMFHSFWFDPAAQV